MKNKLYIIVVLLFVLVLVHGGNSKNNQIAHTKHIASLLSSTPSPLPTNTSTPSPTPTPTPLPGYCLHVPVIFYHHVQPTSMAKELGQIALNVDNEIFDKQMEYLSSHGYATITAKQLVDGLKNNTTLPQKSIVITFDDGYKNDYDYIYPILQKYHLVGNFMIATGLIGGPQYLTWGQVEEMAHSGIIYFTNHTWSHFAINSGSTDKIKFEIETARQQLEEHTGQSINIFTYPYGSFNDNAISILKQDGFVGAFSTIPGFWQCDSFIMSLHRNRIGNAPLSEYGL